MGSEMCIRDSQILWEPDEAALASAAAGDARAAGLERLYGKGVVPQGLRGALNCGLDQSPRGEWKWHFAGCHSWL